jgi:SAM-dependent methyltransferase
MTPDWLFDESGRAGRENLDAAHVARYDSKMDAAPDDEVALLRSLGLRSQSTLVEFGAGTGQLALAAAAVARRVIAVDVSPPMHGVPPVVTSFQVRRSRMGGVAGRSPNTSATNTRRTAGYSTP